MSWLIQRGVWLVGAGILAFGIVGCSESGGQTGDITMPSLCDSPGERFTAAQVPPGFLEPPTAFVQFDRVNTSLVWMRSRPDSALEVTVMPSASPEVTQLGASACQPRVQMRAEATVRTEDDVLSDTFRGSLIVGADGQWSAQLLLDVSDISGTLDPFAELDFTPTPNATLYMLIANDSDATRGTLYLRADQEDEEQLAQWETNK